MSMTEWLGSTLSTDHDKPVAWRNSVGAALGGILGVLFGLLVDRVTGGQTVALSGLCGVFLGLLTAMGPFVMALRLVVTSGVLMILVAALGSAATGRPWLATLGMVFLVFIATVWTSIPMIGPLLGTFPTIVYLLLLAKGTTLTESADEIGSMLGAAAGLLGALITLVIMSGWDVRKQTRRLAAGAWGADVTWAKMSSILLVLRLDAAPKALMSLTQLAVLATLSREWLSAEKATPQYQAATGAQQAIAATLLPRGPIVPRTITPPISDDLSAVADRAGASTAPRERFCWGRWHYALHHAEEILAGRAKPSVVPIPSRSLGRTVVMSVLRPQSASFRYGVQRALALGVATFVMVSTTIPQSFWFLLALFSIMQTNARATWARAVQYAFGTWLGAVGAVALSFVLPASVIGFLALGLLIAGFAWLLRNYTVMAAALAAAVVLLTGLPDGAFLQWAAVRALDITAAAIAAVLVSSFILRVRPQPVEHVAAAKAALLDVVENLKRRLTDPQAPTAPTLQREGAFLLQRKNVQDDLAMMKDASQVEQQLHDLQEANVRLISLAAVIYSGELDDQRDTPIVDRGLDQLDSRIRSIGQPAATDADPEPGTRGNSR